VVILRIQIFCSRILISYGDFTCIEPVVYTTTFNKNHVTTIICPVIAITIVKLFWQQTSTVIPNNL